MSRYVALSCLALLLFCTVSHAEWTLTDMRRKDAEGNLIIVPKPLEARFKNAISPADEKSFQQRVRAILEAQSQLKVPAGNTYFENEKRTYGYLMAQILASKEQAIRDIQFEDAQAKEWHRETAGIDFFAAFTIKHQTRKYFYFGDLLDPDYRDRMLQGAKSWTAEDPLKRPHYAFKGPGGGWGPNEKNSWVDVRSTENLYLMRVSAVYLFAEAAGNKAVAAKYKDEIKRYTVALYRVGMGEWDSENYHGHSLAPLCNLYDFSQDEEVRLLAKASLDWMFTAGAVKYYRGAFNGPTKRDYNHPQPFGGSAANMLSVHFGDCPPKEKDWESDEVHLITSNYRPPAAVLHLARKNFAKPVELFASKPPYSATTSGNSKAQPEYAETQYFGHSFQMGSLPTGTSEDGGDVNGFKLVMFDGPHGAIALQGVPGPDPKYCGSPKYEKGKVAGPNRVGQYGNIAIWLVQNGQAPWSWVVPKTVKASTKDEVTFLEAERTWIALRPLGTSRIEINEPLTKTVADGDKPAFPAHQVLTATGNSTEYCGVAIEVGEKQSHGSFVEFQKQVLAAEVDVSHLADGVVQYKAADRDKKWLGVNWGDRTRGLGVWRNGKRHDWETHAKLLYGSEESAAGIIYSPWGAGQLTVNAGGESFTCSVSEDGKVSFRNEPGTNKPR